MLHGRSKRLQYLGKTVRLFLKPGKQRRSISGKMLAFDDYMNVVLVDAAETRTITQKLDGAKVERVVTRELGFVLIRGTEVLSVSLEKAEEAAKEAEGAAKDAEEPAAKAAKV